MDINRPSTSKVQHPSAPATAPPSPTSLKTFTKTLQSSLSRTLKHSIKKICKTIPSECHAIDRQYSTAYGESFTKSYQLTTYIDVTFTKPEDRSATSSLKDVKFQKLTCPLFFKWRKDTNGKRKKRTAKLRSKLCNQCRSKTRVNGDTASHRLLAASTQKRRKLQSKALIQTPATPPRYAASTQTQPQPQTPPPQSTRPTPILFTPVASTSSSSSSRPTLQIQTTPPSPPQKAQTKPVVGIKSKPSLPKPNSPESPESSSDSKPESSASEPKSDNPSPEQTETTKKIPKIKYIPAKLLDAGIEDGRRIFLVNWKPSNATADQLKDLFKRKEEIDQIDNCRIYWKDSTQWEDDVENTEAWKKYTEKEKKNKK